MHPLFDSTDASQLNLWAGEIKAETMKATDTDAWLPQRLIHKPNLIRRLQGKRSPGTTTEPVDVNDLRTVDEPMEMRVEPLWDEQPAVDSIEPSAIEQPLEDEQIEHDEDMRILADGPVSNSIAEPEITGTLALR